MGKNYIPDRGDVVWLNFNPQRGHEQAGKRPALVLSPAKYNGKVSLMLVCPITNQQKHYPFEVVIPKSMKKVAGVVLADQIRSVDWRVRGVSFIEKMPANLVTSVLKKSNTLLTA